MIYALEFASYSIFFGCVILFTFEIVRTSDSENPAMLSTSEEKAILICSSSLSEKTGLIQAREISNANKIQYLPKFNLDIANKEVSEANWQSLAQIEGDCITPI